MAFAFSGSAIVRSGCRAALSEAQRPDGAMIRPAGLNSNSVAVATRYGHARGRTRMIDHIFPAALIGRMSDGCEPGAADLDTMARHVRRDLAVGCRSGGFAMSPRAGDERSIMAIAMASLRGVCIP